MLFSLFQFSEQCEFQLKQETRIGSLVSISSKSVGSE